MNVSELKSTDDLRKVNKQLRRRMVVTKANPLSAQIVYTAGVYKARYQGQPDVAFGIDKQQALQRLHKLPNMIRVVIPYFDDREAERKEWLAECAAARAAKNSRNFDPKRG